MCHQMQHQGANQKKEVGRQTSSRGVLPHPCSCLRAPSVVLRDDSLGPYGPWPPRVLCLWYSPSKPNGVFCHALLQGIYLPNPGIKPRSPVLQAPSMAGGFFTGRPAKPLGIHPSPTCTHTPMNGTQKWEEQSASWQSHWDKRSQVKKELQKQP